MHGDLGGAGGKMMGAATTASAAAVVVVLLSMLRPAAAILRGERSDDLIDWLPNGPEDTEFRQYSGYLNYGRTGEAQFFYYFVEAVGEDPTTKPLILYLGCHLKLCSPLTAAFQQMGPFRVDTDGQSLLENPDSWNKAANLLFLEVPAILGFSFATNVKLVSDISDYSMALQAHKLLNLWLARFPEYRGSDLYIAGQADMGTVGPLIALRVLHQNRKHRGPPINLKGLILGNPNMDLTISKVTKAEFYWQMGLMPYTTYHSYLTECSNATNFDEDTHVRGGGNFVPPRCIDIWSPVDENTAYLDRFSLLAPPCPDIDSSKIEGPYSFSEFVYTCKDQYVAGYLSVPFMQKAIHVKSPPGITDPPVWMPSKGGSDWTRNLQSAVSLLREMLDRGVRILIYSGVLDYALPNIAAEEVLTKVNLTMDTAWRPWFGKSPIEFAGYTVSYKDGLTYATLRNSGRKAGQDQPENLYAMFSSFINNQPLPKSSYFPDP